MMEMFMTPAVVHANMRVAMVCFAAGLMMIFIGRLVWKQNKPEYLPGYKKIENEDTKDTKEFSKLAGQAHVLGGIGLLMLSFPLNEERPDGTFATAMLIGCLIMVILGVARYMKAMKLIRRKKP